MPMNPAFPSLYDLKPNAEGGTLRAFFGIGGGSFDPAVSEHKTQLAAIEHGILTGTYSDDEIKAFVQKNPATMPLVAQAIQKRDIYQRNFQPAVAPNPLTEGEILGSNLGAKTIDPSAQISPLDQARLQEAREGKKAVNNIPGAINELSRAGLFDEAKKLHDINKTVSESGPYAKVDPRYYTNDSLKKFEETKKYSDLVPNDKIKEDKDRQFQHAKNLRNEFTDLSKTFIDVRDSYSRIQGASKDPSAAGDLALIFNYMKMLDPRSVVRESEFATAANAAGVPDRIRAMYNRVRNGERLSEAQRNDFVGRSDILYKRQLSNHSQLERQYSVLARRAGVDHQDVIVDFKIPESELAQKQVPGLPSGWSVRVK